MATRRPTRLNTLHLLFVAVLPAVIAISASAQPARLWERALREDRSEILRGALALPGGGLLLAGEINNPVPYQADIYLARLTSYGDSLWAGYDDLILTQHVTAIAAHPQGAVVTGSYAAEEGSTFYSFPYLQAVSANGQFLWRQTYPVQAVAEAKTVLATPDGGWLLGGYFGGVDEPAGYRDAYLIKTNANGQQEWSEIIDIEGGRDEVTCLAVRPGGGYIAGVQAHVGGADGNQICLLTINALGEEVNRTVYGGVGDELIYDLRLRDDGGIDLCGEFFNVDIPIHYTDAFYHRLDPNGALLIDRVYGAVGYDGFRAMLHLEDGGFMFGGHAQSYSGNGSDDLYVVRTDPDGVEQWHGSFGGDMPDKGYALVRLDQPGEPAFVIAGNSRSYSQNNEWDMFAVRFADRPPHASLALDAAEQPILLPDGGGSFTFSATLANLTDQPRSYQAWVSVFTPATAIVQPLNLTSLTLPPNDTVAVTLTQPVPGALPAGEYRYIANLGLYPFFTVARDTLDLLKEEGDSMLSVPPPPWPAIQRSPRQR